LPNIKDFSQMLVDVCMHASPVLSFMDGIVAMEGPGPSGGDPRQVGVIIASNSPDHLDVMACKIVGINPLEVPTIARAIERNIVKRDFSDLQLVLDSDQSFYISDFKIPKIHGVGLLSNKVPKWLDGWIDHMIKPKPVIREHECIACGECVLCCPAKTIEMKNNKPVIHLNDCIRCFCCQELCPAKAIKVHRTFIANKLIKF
jgi:ferredoxin